MRMFVSPNYTLITDAITKEANTQEMYLKNMIITGIITWQSANGGTFEL